MPVYPAAMDRVRPVPLFLSVAGNAEKPEPPLMPRATPFGRRFLTLNGEALTAAAILGGLAPARRSAK